MAWTCTNEEGLLFVKKIPRYVRRGRKFLLSLVGRSNGFCSIVVIVASISNWISMFESIIHSNSITLVYVIKDDTHWCLKHCEPDLCTRLIVWCCCIVFVELPFCRSWKPSFSSRLKPMFLFLKISGLIIWIPLQMWNVSLDWGANVLVRKYCLWSFAPLQLLNE